MVIMSFSPTFPSITVSFILILNKGAPDHAATICHVFVKCMLILYKVYMRMEKIK